MNDLLGIYALWYREYKVFLRERSRLVASVVNPVLWLLIIGGGFGSVVSFGNVSFLTFLFPGILVQLSLFSAIFFGVYIVWDKKIDFLKEVLVSPLSRTSIFIGKVLGGSTDTLIQLAILLVLGYIFSLTGIMETLPLSVNAIVLVLAFLFVITAGFASVGLILGSQMESPEGFQLISSFLVTPMFFLSGALFPIDNLPGWLMPFVLLNPATYAVDGIRGVLVGLHQFSIGFDFLVVCLFSGVMILAGTYAFEKMRL
ncbi:ABC-2 type transporter [Methanoregula boonei 6A8]|jgi:ABC-2 type transport system permease protein|uniref:ABC-2 type transporter n=1 Tax=Methanoregula boonei (strain DSM 21154 / JCM 14090 / 6A8) TaxID=456442 RepID=A7I5D4_METB6|nr:ABC transporter permease [Methanoregula boonei]ABS54945.1 ABC-2 type transporter [Methanoregula boonei 6A8]